MPNTCVIKLSQHEIIYDGEKFEEAINPQIHITKDIFDDTSNVITGRKKNYNIFQGSGYKMVGYCYSLSFAMDVVRSMMAQQIKKGVKYEIHIKKISSEEIKIYLYEYIRGWIYNGLSLVDKFKIMEVPKVEMKKSALVNDK